MRSYLSGFAGAVAAITAAMSPAVAADLTAAEKRAETISVFDVPPALCVSRC